MIQKNLYGENIEVQLTGYVLGSHVRNHLEVGYGYLTAKQSLLSCLFECQPFLGANLIISQFQGCNREKSDSLQLQHLTRGLKSMCKSKEMVFFIRILGTSICRLSPGCGVGYRILPLPISNILCLEEVHGKPEECRRKRLGTGILF